MIEENGRTTSIIHSSLLDLLFLFNSSLLCNLYHFIIGLKGAQCKNCPICTSHFAPNMIDSIHDMKTTTPTIRPPILLEQAPITLIKLLEKFINGERKFAAVTFIDNNPNPGSALGGNVTPGGVNGNGGAMVEFADMFTVADSSAPLNSSTGNKGNNDGNDSKALPTSASSGSRPASGVNKRPSSAPKLTPTADGTQKTLTPASARLAKRQAELLAAQVASLVKKQTAKTMTSLFIDLMSENWKNYIQGNFCMQCIN